jgi:hypothetical protein
MVKKTTAVAFPVCSDFLTPLILNHGLSRIESLGICSSSGGNGPTKDSRSNKIHERNNVAKLAWEAVGFLSRCSA